MSIVQFLFYGSLLALTLCFLGCRKPKALYTINDLQGNWIRIQSSKPIYDSMTVIIEEDIGRISTIPPNNYFDVGDLKWNNILPKKDSSFSYQDLGSDGNYYNGTIALSKNLSNNVDLLFITIEQTSGANGSTQIWKKLP